MDELKQTQMEWYHKNDLKEDYKWDHYHCIWAQSIIQQLNPSSHDCCFAAEVSQLCYNVIDLKVNRY